VLLTWLHQLRYYQGSIVQMSSAVLENDASPTPCLGPVDSKSVDLPSVESITVSVSVSLVPAMSPS
jgi:hypothetical protein